MLVTCTRSTQNLLHAIDTRNLVGQAQGTLMQEHGLAAERAVGVLRRYSQHNNLELAWVGHRSWAQGGSRLTSYT